jgi:hypothetical protein
MIQKIKKGRYVIKLRLQTLAPNGGGFHTPFLALQESEVAKMHLLVLPSLFICLSTCNNSRTPE